MQSVKYFGIFSLLVLSLGSCQDQTQMIKQDIPLQFEIRSEITDLNAIAFDRTISTLSIEQFSIPAIAAYSVGDRINFVEIESIAFKYRGFTGAENYDASVNLQVAQNPTSSFLPLASGSFEDLKREVFYGRQNLLTKFEPQEEVGPSDAIQLLEQSLRNQTPFLLRVSKIYNDSIPTSTQVSIIFKGKINVNAFEIIEEEEVIVDSGE